MSIDVASLLIVVLSSLTSLPFFANSLIGRRICLGLDLRVSENLGRNVWAVNSVRGGGPIMVVLVLLVVVIIIAINFIDVQLLGRKRLRDLIGQLCFGKA